MGPRLSCAEFYADSESVVLFSKIVMVLAKNLFYSEKKIFLNYIKPTLSCTEFYADSESVFKIWKTFLVFSKNAFLWSYFQEEMTCIASAAASLTPLSKPSFPPSNRSSIGKQQNARSKFFLTCSFYVFENLLQSFH